MGEHTQDDEKETTLGLIYVALEKVEEAQQQLEALRQYHYTTEKEEKALAAPVTQGDQPS